MDDATSTTKLPLSNGVFATSHLSWCTLLNTGSPQSFVHRNVFNQMVATEVTDALCVRCTNAGHGVVLVDLNSLAPNNGA